MGTVLPSFHYKYMQHWYFIQFVHIAIFMSSHAPPGTCILVASASPVDVNQYNVYLSIIMRTYINKYIYMHVIQNNLRTPQLMGFAHQLEKEKEA